MWGWNLFKTTGGCLIDWPFSQDHEKLWALKERSNCSSEDCLGINVAHFVCGAAHNSEKWAFDCDTAMCTELYALRVSPHVRST